MFLTGTLVGWIFSSLKTLWLVAMIVFLVIEGIVPGLVSIWFAAGSLAALLAAMLNAPLWLQLTLFVVVTAATLIATRPLAARYVNSRTQATNADRMLGKPAVVIENISNLKGQGAVSIDGKIWTARAEQADIEIPVDTIVIVERIEGVKLIVSVK